MKKLKAIVFGLIVTACHLSTSAQEKTFKEPDYNKPQLFADLPQKMNAKLLNADALLNFSVGSSVSAQIAEGFSFNGTVVSKADDATVKSIVIRSTNREGAIFSFSKIKNEDGSFTYRGRIISRNNSDALELVKENNQYVLRKINYYDLVNE